MTEHEPPRDARSSVETCARCNKVIGNAEDAGCDEAGFAVCEACTEHLIRFENWFPGISHR